jgi:hypothetical protein
MAVNPRKKIYLVRKSNVELYLDLNTETAKLTRLLYGFQKVATPVKFIAAFRRAEIVSPWDEHAKAL